MVPDGNGNYSKGFRGFSRRATSLAKVVLILVLLMDAPNLQRTHGHP